MENSLEQKENSWVLCHNCKSKTRVKVLKDTVLLNFPLFCPKCRKEHLIDIQCMEIITSEKIKNERARR